MNNGLKLIIAVCSFAFAGMSSAVENMPIEKKCEKAQIAIVTLNELRQMGLPRDEITAIVEDFDLAGNTGDKRIGIWVHRNIEIAFESPIYHNQFRYNGFIDLVSEISYSTCYDSFK